MTGLQMISVGLCFFLTVLLLAWLWRGYSNVVNALIEQIKGWIIKRGD